MWSGLVNILIHKLVVNLFKSPFIEPWHTNSCLSVKRNWGRWNEWGMVEWQQNWRRAEEEQEEGQWEVKWRWESPATLEVPVFPHNRNKNRLKLTVEPLTCLWPGERDRGRRTEGGTEGRLRVWNGGMLLFWSSSKNLEEAYKTGL